MDDGELGQLRTSDYYLPINNEDYPKKPPEVKQMPVNNAEEDDLEDKSRICANIFNNPLFEMKNEESIHFDLEETETVRTLQRHIPVSYTHLTLPTIYSV